LVSLIPKSVSLAMGDPMPTIIFWTAGALLSACVVFEVIKTARDYPRFNQAVARDEADGRVRF
jgi:hypothetical protein